MLASLKNNCLALYSMVLNPKVKQIKGGDTALACADELSRSIVTLQAALMILALVH